MAEPTEQDREKARDVVSDIEDARWSRFSTPDVTEIQKIIAQALADERRARDEHWAKWHEEHSAGHVLKALRAGEQGDEERAKRWEARAQEHTDSAAAIWAKGKVK